MALRLTSSAFEDGGLIPRAHTCDGEDVSPPLSWSGAPEGTKSFALLCDDPDAPRGDWVHWVLFNLPAEMSALPEAVPKRREGPSGSIQGVNDFGKPGWGGPCPPVGTHRYVFRVWALDTTLALPAGAKKADLLGAIERHVLGQARLVGRYSRG